MAKKVLIDYLQFLNLPELDAESKVWFFTYLEPNTEEIKRVNKIYQKDIQYEYKKIQKKLIVLQKKRKVKIETETVVVEEKKKQSKIKNIGKDVKNKLISKEINTKALELKVQGLDREEIIIQLMSTYNISLSVATQAERFVYEELSKDVDEDFIRFTVMNHSKYYDQFYKKLIDLNAPKIAMRALKTKEQLNGISQDIFEIQVNNVFEDQKDLVSYGISKLNEEEQKEFVNILSRIQAISDEKQKRLA